MFRLCSAVVLVGLLPACAHRTATPLAADVTPTDSTWESTLACSEELLASAGYHVRVGNGGLSASRPGSLITSDPPVESIDHVVIYRSDEPSGWIGESVSYEFKRPSTARPGHWRIMAMSSAVHDVTPSEGGRYMTTLAPSADVRAIAHQVRQQCSQA